MKIDFSQTLKNPWGDDIRDSSSKPEKIVTHEDGTKEPIFPAMTLARAAMNALLADYRDEKLSGQEKAKRYSLACLLVNEGPIDLEVEQCALIKEVIGKAYSPLVVGPAYALLEKES